MPPHRSAGKPVGSALVVTTRRKVLCRRIYLRSSVRKSAATFAAEPRPKAAQNADHSWCKSVGDVVRIRSRDSTPPPRAPKHISDTDTWGVSDPADGSGATSPIRRRGRSRPISVRHMCWGAEGAARDAALVGRADQREGETVQGVAARALIARRNHHQSHRALGR
jgi:hypothetical protein